MMSSSSIATPTSNGEMLAVVPAAASTSWTRGGARRVKGPSLKVVNSTPSKWIFQTGKLWLFGKLNCSKSSVSCSSKVQ